MNRTMYAISIFLAGTALHGCKKKEAAVTKDPVVTTGSGSATGADPGSGSSAAVATGSGSAGSADGSAAGSGSAAASGFDPGELKTPESVYYDAGRDMYMVSNINGKPLDKDDNGYLTVVNPDGSNDRAAANWKWIDGAADDIKLDAPKGMAISGDTLFVADIDVVRQFEAKAGKQKADIKIEGATFLNDVTPDGKGGVFVSDSGLDASFAPTGTDAIWHVAADGKVTALIKNKDLGGPNGVWADAKGSVWVVTFRTGELYEVTAKGAKQKAIKLPKGQLDGIVGLEGGDLLISSWEGKSLYRGKPGGAWKEIATGIESPADIGYDPKRKKILIPSFMGNTITLLPVE
jgi:hypothetical protein